MFILITFSLLLTQKQYFGDPIDCIADFKNELDLLDAYCWIQSTFTLPQITNEVQPGIHNQFHPLYDKPLKLRYHSYYQWVTLFLCLQALMFYIPRYLWKIWEGGKLKMLIEGMHLPIIDEEEMEKKKTFLISFMKINANQQNLYAYKFFFCELLNFINVLVQIYITDAFVGYEFTSYGTKVLDETQTAFYSRNDTLELVFPKVTKCTFNNYGPGGTPQRIDALCVLPLNVFNEKLYIFLWFWFIFIAVISSLGLLYRLGTFFQPFRQILLRSKAKFAKVEDVDRVTQKYSIGDWFLIYQIAKNMDENLFKNFISDLAQDL